MEESEETTATAASASTVGDSTAAAAIDSIASGGEIKVDDEHDAKEAVLLRYFLQEWELVKSLLDQIVGSHGISDPSDVRKIRSIIDKYQEQGQLLEPYLESIVSPLMHIVRSKTMQLGVANDEVLEIIKPLCIIIYTLVTVCGYKSVVKFFPHQVSDLELAVSLLEKCHRTAPMSSSRQESTGEMETKCIILLWLYILVLIPFDLSSVDTSIADGKYMDGSGPSPLVINILEISKDYLSSAGPMRRISGLLLSKLLTRPDMLKSFDSFTKWAHEVLLSVTDDVVNHFRFLGVVEALASIFKVGSRKIFLNVLSTTWSDCSLLMNSSTAARSPLLRKLVIKLSQYIGLNCLPQRSPSWRYLGKNGILLENISIKATEEGKLINHAQLGDNQNYMQHGPCLEEDMYVPEIVEEIIELLLTGLRDSDTVVRWCAAKGVGRITSRLTSSFSEDVLSSLLELFSPGEGDGSWHGGCLAIAELARRGLLLPVNFPKVVPFIIKALHYDIRRGPHSIGSHVRDAAAYVCWAFGRAYSNSDMKGILEQLAPHLLTVSCYDREVNCRRAASAAFQENVGRQGTFPHGIDIVNTADYFSLSSRANSYLHVAVWIAQYKEYLYPFVEELICYKISHWDKSLREMAAVSLSALAKYDHDFFATYVLDKLIPCTLSLDLCMRHGATLAIGELVLSLHQRGYIFPHEKQKSISCIVPAIEKARLYRGKGGEIMRSSVSRLIECISLSGILLTEKTKLGLLNTLNENLKHPNTQIQRTAIDALGKFVKAYFIVADVDDKVANNITSKYIQLLDDPNVAGRRGAALALGILPYGFLAVRWKVVIKKLCSCCTSQDNPDDLDAEARVNAVCGLVSVCETLSEASINQNSEDVRSLYFFIKTDVVQTLFTALNDYSVDNRGDVGSWVREAAMHGLERCTYILCERDSVISMKKPGFEHPLEARYGMDSTDPSFLLFDAKIATDLIGGLAKQAVEKIDKIREIAAKTLQKILYNQKYFISFIPHRNILEDIIPRDPDANWAVPTFSYPRMVRLLQCNCYSKSILSGLVLSVGGLQESLRRVAVSALLDYIQAAEGDLDEKINTKKYILSNDLLWILQQYQKCDRVITPTLKTIEILLSSKVFLQMEVFGSGILDSLAVELKGSKDFTKLCTGLSVLGYVASLVEDLSSRALSQLLSFLGHRYPKIRKAAADQVYLVLLQNESLIAEEKLERALEVVAETCWEASMEEAKSGRLRLYDMVSGKESSASFRVSNPETSKRSERITKTDENVSYSSLVDFRGF